MPKVNSGLGVERRTNDIDQWGIHLNRDERTQWMRDHLGLSEKDAREQGDAINYFSHTYDDIHNDRDDYRNDLINKAIANPNAPIYTGEQFRGLSIKLKNMPAGLTPMQFIEKIIHEGEWRENGATSFSASISVARDFAESYYHNPNQIPVIIHYQGPHGMPIKHLSEFSYENEILHSQKQMKGGYDIVEHHWDGHEFHMTIKNKRK